jgi:hypothetical protein
METERPHRHMRGKTHAKAWREFYPAYDGEAAMGQCRTLLFPTAQPAPWNRDDDLQQVSA